MRGMKEMGDEKEKKKKWKSNQLKRKNDKGDTEEEIGKRARERRRVKD